MRLKFFASALFIGFLLSFPSFCNAGALSIRNQTNLEIINIMVSPQKGPNFFLRLDLLPGKGVKVENPDCEAALRVDTGLEFWFFDKVDLKNANEMVFCNEHNACIILLSQKDGQAGHMRGKIQGLVPAPGSKPVCELGQFRPRMPMKDVCAILEANTPRDDNGSLLTGLGFAGMLWAARLAPTKPENGNEADSILEHMELRKPLSLDSARAILDALFRQGYVPWQAEFPNLDMDFADMPKQDEAGQKRMLMEAMARFMENQRNGDAQKNAAYQQDDEARVLMAPASSLRTIANADSPEQDVQLFTILLQPRCDTLLLDVAAYEADNGGETTN